MAGQTIETEVELAELYEMNENGAYSVLAAGAIPYAELNSTMLTGQALQYSSNTLSLDVDAAKAKAVPFAVDVIAKRTAVQSDCTGSQRSAVLSALSSCRTLATAAATAATSGSASKFQEYFKTFAALQRSQPVQIKLTQAVVPLPAPAPRSQLAFAPLPATVAPPPAAPLALTAPTSTAAARPTSSPTLCRLTTT